MLCLFVLLVACFLTDLRIKPIDRSGRVTAHFFVLASVNLFFFSNSALFDDLSGRFFLGQI